MDERHVTGIHHSNAFAVIAGLTRNLICIRDTLSPRRLRMFLRNEGKGSGFDTPSLVSHVNYQKTKGLIFSEEKKTIRYCPERNLSTFFCEWLSKICRT